MGSVPLPALTHLRGGVVVLSAVPATHRHSRQPVSRYHQVTRANECRNGRASAHPATVISRQWLRLGVRRGPEWPEVGVLTVAVEDRQHLDGTAEAGDPMRCHRVELCGLTGFDEILALTEH